MSADTPTPQFRGVLGWIDHRLPVVSLGYNHLVVYPTPKNLNYWWNFGSLAGIMLIIQIVTGIVLAMHYVPHADMAFDSVERIMRDVNYGWLLRYGHAVGASMFFIVVYIHMFRGLYYGSYKAPRELLWMIGVVILILMMATAFTGYVLPWGQMSFWAAVVIINLFGAIPLVGDTIVTWLMGGFAVDNATLQRFFSIHYLLPFTIVAMSFLHLVALHQFGSNNPVGIDLTKKDKINFHPYYTVKDVFGLFVFLTIYALFVFYAPLTFAHIENYEPANALVTPAHIVPDWYFMPFYAILASFTFDISIFGITLMDAKLAGVLAMFAAVLILFFLPWLDTSKVRSATYRPLYRIAFWVFVVVVLLLGYSGSQPAEGAWLLIGQITTFYYFFHFLVLLPLLGKIEKPLPVPESINKPVLPTASAGAQAQPAE
ncbi:MAG: cytochrome b [Geminicoccaceae bacterium]|nr:MAG: cytochrome b [Geminicoccaceae bacterium]